MKCLSTEELDAYLSNELSLAKSNQVDEHLQNCKHCQQQFIEYVDQLETNNDRAEQTIDTRIVAHELVAKLPPYPIYALKRKQYVNRQEEMHRRKRGIGILKKTSLLVAGLTVVVLVGPVIFSPLAIYVNGLYASLHSEDTTVLMNHRIDQEIHNNQKEWIKQLNAKSTDQGITLEVKEVFADTRKIELITSIEGERGETSEGLALMKDVHFQIKDKAGRIYEADGEASSFPRKQRLGANLVLLSRDLTPIFYEAQKIPNELMIEISTKKIGNTTGNWKIEIPLDLSKAKAATKTVAINKRYTSPQGISFHLREISFAPSSTQLIIDTNIPKGAYHDRFSYQLVDEQGTVLAGWSDYDQRIFIWSDFNQSSFKRNDVRHNPFLDETEKNPVNIFKNQVNRFYVTTKDQHLRLLANSYPLPKDKKMMFTLHSIYKVEPVVVSTKLNLEELSTKPVKVEDQGSLFIFKDVKYEAKNQGTKEAYTEASIVMEGILAKDIVYVDEWEVKDEKGNTYIAIFDRGVGRNSNGNAVMNGELRIQQLEKLPKELTITYKRKIKEDRNVEWEVPIQVGK
ncbi:DUF4179 domain-containing protein [Brevibacillus halotolerans]|uniref:DUF4179 domain-containing protein n=1 Tax=Brevibacillus halotolerans TaxID=1507437 RepID=UPI0015EF8F46|nr:DUF4179 domain-containing protein [Brevibacillus halotolerans]MBA4533046.1 DUF4179 domain-containing protein [Brevibacillus halotolerans]